jgi:hypothetical protein
VSGPDTRAELHEYLRGAREVLEWKLDGLSEYDVRRPLTPTGTNLLGLLKHSGSTHVRYFGEVFGRPGDRSLLWLCGGAVPNGELWARPEESRAQVVEACRRAWGLADATIEALPLDAPGTVPWWGPEPVSLHRVLVHVTAESQRHAGHADIARELVDGEVGLLPGFDNLRIGDPTGRRTFLDQVEADARRAAEG